MPATMSITESITEPPRDRIGWALGLLHLVLTLALFGVVGGMAEGRPTMVGQVLPGLGWFHAWLTPGPTGEPSISAYAAAHWRFVALLGLSAATYAAALCLASALALSVRAALAIALIVQVAGFLAPAMLSGDVYAYLMYGRIWTIHGANPYVDVPAMFARDPLLSLLFWADVTSVYGPLWTVISGPIAAMTADNIPLGVTAFRLVGLLCAVMTILVVHATLRAIRPVDVPMGVVLLGWNPLFAIEATLGAHNDGVLMLCGALAMGAIVMGRRSSGLVLAGLAGLVKVAGFWVLPLLVLHVRSRPNGLAVVTKAAFVVGAVGVVSALPFVRGPDTFGLLWLGTGDTRYVNGLGEVALTELRVLLGESRADTEVPLQFTGHWVTTTTRAPLRATRGDAAPVEETLAAGAPLLVVAPQFGRWLRVHEPRSRTTGYVRANVTAPLPGRPPEYDRDVDVLARERGPGGSRALQVANWLVRIVSWGGVAAVFVVFARRGLGDIPRLFEAAVATGLALLYLAAGWFWPWYVLWVLPFAALAPRGVGSAWVACLTCSVLLVYVLLALGETPYFGVYQYRAVLMFGMPLLFAVGLVTWRRRLAAHT
jgi:hypothetical protein